MASLREKITAEQENVARALQDLERALTRPESSVIELAAAGTFLHNVYSGFENILKQILQAQDVALPQSSSSHKDLVNLAVAENIISQFLADDIFPYLTFRHFFIHAYGFMLDDEPILRLAAKIKTIHSRFNAEIELTLQRIVPNSSISATS